MSRHCRRCRVAKQTEISPAEQDGEDEYYCGGNGTSSNEKIRQFSSYGCVVKPPFHALVVASLAVGSDDDASLIDDGACEALGGAYLSFSPVPLLHHLILLLNAV